MSWIENILGKSPDANLKRRFLSKVNQDTLDDCWLWAGTKGTRGYGRFRLCHNRQDGAKRGNVVAHRASYALFVGDPGNLLVCHKCDNPACVNPDHLFLGTNKDNVHDMYQKGRDALSKGTRYQPNVSGALNGRAVLTPERVRSIRNNADGLSIRELAILYGVNKRTIKHIQMGTTWKNI